MRFTRDVTLPVSAKNRPTAMLLGVNAMANGAVIVTDYVRQELLRMWPNGLPH